LRLAAFSTERSEAEAKLTEPGPFLPRTVELGAYFGIHESGSLVAMAGERLKLILITAEEDTATL